MYFPWHCLHRNYTKVLRNCCYLVLYFVEFFTSPYLCRVKNNTTSNLIVLSVHVTWCWMATEFINLVLYVFSVWLCVHIRWLAWPSCYTTLAWVRHCFPSHYPRSGQRSLQGGNVTRRIARWTFQDGHLVSFDFFFPFLVCFLSYSPMLSNSDCLYLESTVMLICSVVLYLLFWFVVLIIVQPPTPSLSSATAAACVWLNSLQVATAHRWDVYHTWNVRRITNTLHSSVTSSCWYS